MLLKTVIISALGVSLVLGMSGPGSCQDSTGVFVVYGTVYEPDSVTVHDEDGFTITVHNMTTGRMDEVPLGTYDGAGKYSVVWIQYSDSSAVASVGDVIHVFADHHAMLEECNNATHMVTTEDIGNNRIEINLCCPIAAAHSSWGAIKAIYRR